MSQIVKQKGMGIDPIYIEVDYIGGAIHRLREKWISKYMTEQFLQIVMMDMKFSSTLRTQQG